MFKVTKLSVCAVIACAFGIGSVASAPAAPSVAPPTDVSITSFGVNGSGCPGGSATYSLNSDNTGFSVHYRKFYAEAGPNVAPSENRKNCQLTLGLSIPAGYSFALASTQAQGYYYLDSSVSATQETIYYFQGSLNQGNASQTVVGPIPGAFYNYDAKFPISTFSPCKTSAVLNIDASIRANNDANPNGLGFVATDSTHTSLTQVFNFAWQAC